MSKQPVPAMFYVLIAVVVLSALADTNGVPTTGEFFIELARAEGLGTPSSIKQALSMFAAAGYVVRAMPWEATLTQEYAAQILSDVGHNVVATTPTEPFNNKQVRDLFLHLKENKKTLPHGLNYVVRTPVTP
jgi:hypothetical protein